MPIRVRYFDKQFLKVDEFTAEQGYHVAARRRLNRAFQGAGVVEGLEVKALDSGKVSVGRGLAIDIDGHEIVVDVDSAPVPVTGAAPNATVLVTIAYDEIADPASIRKDSAGAATEPTRTLERAKLRADPTPPPADDKAVTLASFKLNAQGQVPLDQGPSLGSTGRSFAGARQLAAAAVGRGDLSVFGNLCIGAEKVENSEGWDKVIDVAGTVHAKLSLRTVNSSTAIEGRLMVHETGCYGSQPGMVIGTTTAQPVSFIANGGMKMSVTKDGVFVASPFTVQGGQPVSFGGQVTAPALNIGGAVAVSGELTVGQKIRSPQFRLTQFYADVKDPRKEEQKTMPYSGGTLLLLVSGTATSKGPGVVGVDVIVNHRSRGTVGTYSSTAQAGQVPFSGMLVLSNLEKPVAGSSYPMWINAADETEFDAHSTFTMVGVELPF